MAKGLKRTLPYIPLVLWAIVVIFPLYWMTITSFKRPIDINRGVSYLPWVDFTPSLQAWRDLRAGAVPVVQPLINSFVAATISSAVAVALGAMAGYGLARFAYRWGPWRNNDIAFWFISQRMLPPAAAILAFMVMYKYAHLLDTVAGLTIAYIGFNLPFAIWIMRDFFAALPRELEESSLVEGASWPRTFVQVALPLALPGLAATGILLFIFSWNEYFFASLLAFEKAKTMPVTIAGMATAIGVRWWLMSALAIVSMIPTIALGLLLERYIVRGLTTGAVK
ncbi:MAG TPA: carbohydrate ABC transporter permease [Thermomicrobiales bacterium]|nr:carbohydrate ABC transporter permease [Thermomicrobiales bacterium]